MYGVYDLPFGKGQRWAREGWASAVFGGFQVSGVVSWMSGLPFYVIQGSAPNLLAGGSGQVPNQLNPTIDILGGVGTAAQRGSAGWTMVRQYGAWSELHFELCVGAGDRRALWIGGAEYPAWSRFLRDGLEHLPHVLRCRRALSCSSARRR